MFLLRNFVKDTCGATAIEYGLIAGVIALAVITAATTAGTALSAKFDQITNNLT